MGGRQRTSRKQETAAGDPVGARRAREAFKRGVLARGEASNRTEDGKLPAGVTHEIVDCEIVRRRFSAV